MKNQDPNLYQFERIGTDYLTYSVRITQKGKEVEVVKLYGPGRTGTMERLLDNLGYTKAVQVTAFGKTMTGPTWKSIS